MTQEMKSNPFKVGDIVRIRKRFKCDRDMRKVCVMGDRKCNLHIKAKVVKIDKEDMYIEGINGMKCGHHFSKYEKVNSKLQKLKELVNK